MLGRQQRAKPDQAVTFSARNQIISLTCKTRYPLMAGDTFLLASPGRSPQQRGTLGPEATLRPGFMGNCVARVMSDDLGVMEQHGGGFRAGGG